MRAALFLVVLVVHAVPASIAEAQDEDANALIERALALRAQYRDADALPLIERAYALEPSPRIRAQLGLVHHALGHWVDAYEHVSASLATSDPWVARNRAALVSSLGVITEHVARLRVEGPAGAEVRIDGAARGVLPIEGAIAVLPGTVSVEVTARDAAPFTRQLTLREGEQRTLAATFASAVTADGVGADAGGSAIVAPLVVTLVGAALAVAGGVLLAVGIADAIAIDGTPAGTRQWTEAAADADRAYLLQGLGGAGLGVGALTVGVGLVWLTSSGGPSASARVALRGRF